MKPRNRQEHLETASQYAWANHNKSALKLISFGKSQSRQNHTKFIRRAMQTSDDL